MQITDTMAEAAAKAIAGICYAHCGGADSDTLVWGAPNWKFRLREARAALTAALATLPAPAGAEAVVKPLDDRDYQEIFAAARKAKIAWEKDYALQDMPVQSNFDWWVMKETEARIRSALVAPASLPDGWRTIDSAPKDGTHVLLRIAEDDTFICAQGWYESGMADRCWYAVTDIEVSPTHWMPLPAAPKGEQS